MTLVDLLQAPVRCEDAATDPSAVLALGDAALSDAADALHDGALQALVVARYAADLAVRGGDPVAARDAVQDALVALRRAVWQLRPRGEHGLADALRHLAVHLADTDGAALHVDVDEDTAEALRTGLAPVAANAAYRLVQHAAGERAVTVRIRRTATGLRLALDVAVADPAAEALRARAAGGTLLATRDFTALHLPVALPSARTRAVPVVPAQRDRRQSTAPPPLRPLTDLTHEETP